MKQSVIEQAEAQGSDLYMLYKQWFKEVRAIDDGVVGIETVTANDSHKASNGWYTLDGRRVARPTTKGIYLHNGRKLIIR
jgi:alpha-amylase